MDHPKYTLIYQTGKPLARAAETILTWGFLGFLVWLSKGSVFWTFIFGTVAILGIAGRFKHLYDERFRRFATKSELAEFVQALPADE